MAERPASEKLSHEAVQYERPSKHPARHCGNCEHVIEASAGNRCESVEDPIWLPGWCIRWGKA